MKSCESNYWRQRIWWSDTVVFIYFVMMFWGNYTNIIDTFVDVKDWFWVITKNGIQVKDWIPQRYEEKKKYTVKDWLFVEVTE